ncbi:MAG TPA: hypothetical protein VL595_16515, partial [Pseudonocardia sp.]|nr:hypothetical protein [Pseudonocardia sp.]
VDIDDPFATPSQAKVSHRGEIITGGRYRLPHRDGTHKKRGWMRVTNLVSAYSDQFGLRMWEIEQVLLGLAANVDPVALMSALYVELLDARLGEKTRDERREWVEGFIERCKDVSGGNAGAQYGTHRHAVVEAHHAGLPLGYQTPATRRQISLYASTLERNKLVALPGMQERRVLIESLEAVGTLDNILQDLITKLLLIGDLKTQKKFWTFLEIGAQFACYANADAMWDETEGKWKDMPKVSRDVGLVLWMPRPVCPEVDCGKTLPCPDHPGPDPEPHVDIYEVDLVAGWATARRAYEVVRDRAEARAKNTPRAWLRPAPPVTLIEQYAARFAAVESKAEGSALVAEASRAGVWGDILAECARKAAERLLTVTRI